MILFAVYDVEYAFPSDEAVSSFLNLIFFVSRAISVSVQGVQESAFIEHFR